MTIPSGRGAGKWRRVRGILAAARQRYLSVGRTERQDLHQPHSCVGLFAATDLTVLAQCCWPPPLKTLAWIAAASSEQDRRRLVRRLARGELRRILRAELLEAVAVLVGRVRAARHGTVGAGGGRR